MNGKRKREDDRIAFAIHFATGCGEPNAALQPVRNYRTFLEIDGLEYELCRHGSPLRVLWVSRPMWQLIHEGVRDAEANPAKV
jgi:hypothetical protein